VNNELEVVEKSILHALSGQNKAHAEARRAFEGANWEVAGAKPDGAPHSLFQLLNHLIYWQDWVVNWLDGDDPPLPETAADSWTGSVGPASAEAWEEAVARFVGGVDTLSRRSQEAELLSKGDGKSRLEMLQTIASHNSYHLGQVVFLRQMLGAWPPPSGGLTW
jgi:uncharacterized damage-inducible protein DinB